MNKTRLLMTAVVLMAASCTKDATDSAQVCPPEVNAGADQTATLGSLVTLDGTGSSSGGEGCQACDLKYSWSFNSVPTDSALSETALSDNNTASASAPTFTPDVPGTYVLSLTVESGCEEGLVSGEDMVVIDVAASDQLPVANAGSDQTGEVGDRIDLDGSASSDPEGQALTYSWSLSSVPDCSELDASDVFNQSTAKPTVICDCAGVYVAALVVSDGVNYSNPDYASITCTSGNQAPISDAGDSETLPPCNGEFITLDGYGSWDADGDALTYEWSLVSAPTGSTTTDADFSDAGAPDPTFHYDISGEYQFQLQVFDGEFWSAPDVVNITIQDESTNKAPVANAGSDQSVDAEATCTSSSYVWSCGDCDPQEFELDASGSYDPDGDDLTYSWSSTSSVSFSNPVSQAPVATAPAVSGTYGTPQATSFTLQLDVADCDSSDSDTVVVTVNCEGTN